MAQQQEQKDGLALIVGGIFVLALVFAGYNYFNKGDLTEKGDSKYRVEREDEKDGGVEGDLNGDGATSEKEDNAGIGKGYGTGGSTENASTFGALTWKANNYKDGDIKGNKYTVIEGDTLWEIAEGAYGDGTQWTHIRDSNSDSIGVLPSGQQALIIPGQVLVLP